MEQNGCLIFDKKKKGSVQPEVLLINLLYVIKNLNDIYNVNAGGTLGNLGFCDSQDW